MDIKRPLSPSIEPNVTAQNSETQSSSVNPTLQTGIGNIKDGFEAVRQNQFELTSVPQGIQLPAVQRQITSYMSGQNIGDSIFGVMSQYLKMTNSEARENTQLQSTYSQLTLASKSAQLGQQNKAIDQGMKEAAEKYDAAMNEASTEFLIGTAGSLLKGDTANDVDIMSKRLNELKNSADQIKDELLKEPNHDKDTNTVNVRYRYLITWLSSQDKP